MQRAAYHASDDVLQPCPLLLSCSQLSDDDKAHASDLLKGLHKLCLCATADSSPSTSNYCGSALIGGRSAREEPLRRQSASSGVRNRVTLASAGRL